MLRVKIVSVHCCMITWWAIIRKLIRKRPNVRVFSRPSIGEVKLVKVEIFCMQVHFVYNVLYNWYQKEQGKFFFFVTANFTTWKHSLINISIFWYLKLKISAVDLIGLWVFNDTVLLVEENRENHIHSASYLFTLYIVVSKWRFSSNISDDIVLSKRLAGW